MKSVNVVFKKRSSVACFPQADNWNVDANEGVLHIYKEGEIVGTAKWSQVLYVGITGEIKE